jgi:uncharacterized membrane protein
MAIVVGVAVLVRRKGDARHAALGRLYLAAMIVVNFSVLGLYGATGQPGPFHVLAVVSIVTTSLGWLSLQRRGRGHRAVEAHAAFMTWSWIGVVTAGVAQAANHQWPEQSPWPVVCVVGIATAAGLVCVPRFVSRQLRRR